jgi:hypothetical protein
MRSKMFVMFMIVAASFALGCGGGGGGGDSTIVTPATTYNLTGTAETPANGDTGWSASIKAAISLDKATAEAFKFADSTSVSDKQTLSSTGAFSLKVTPASGVFVKITNSKGLELRKYVGDVTADAAAGTVNASSTIEALLNEYGLSTTDTFAVTTLTNAINTLFGSAPTLTTSETVFTKMKSDNAATLSGLTTAITDIKANNTLVETALKAANLNDALPYFSANFLGVEGDATTNLDNFKTVTQNRFNQYDITTYTFTVVDVTFTDADTAVVKVNASIAAQDKTAGTTKGPVTLTEWPITWKKENSKWVVYRNFPYLSSQIF